MKETEAACEKWTELFPETRITAQRWMVFQASVLGIGLEDTIEAMHIVRFKSERSVLCEEELFRQFERQMMYWRDGASYAQGTGEE
jgi:hypothetical protein